MQGGIHQHNLGGIRGNTSGTAQRDRDIGFFERNGVVNAVADKTDGPPLGLQLFNELGFVFGQGIGKIVIDAQLLCQRTGRRFLITGNDVEGQVAFAQFGQHRLCLWADGWFQFNRPHHLLIDRHHDQRMTLPMCVLLQTHHFRCQGNLRQGHKPVAAHLDQLASNLRLDAVAGFITTIAQGW